MVIRRKTKKISKSKIKKTTSRKKKSSKKQARKRTTKRATTQKKKYARDGGPVMVPKRHQTTFYKSYIEVYGPTKATELDNYLDKNVHNQNINTRRPRESEIYIRAKNANVAGEINTHLQESGFNSSLNGKSITISVRKLSTEEKSAIAKEAEIQRLEKAIQEVSGSYQGKHSELVRKLVTNIRKKNVKIEAQARSFVYDGYIKLRGISENELTAVVALLERDENKLISFNINPDRKELTINAKPKLLAPEPLIRPRGGEAAAAETKEKPIQKESEAEYRKREGEELAREGISIYRSRKKKK